MTRKMRFRPHHFLCMLTYSGQGYSTAFIKNFDAIAHNINHGDVTIEIVNGADDICAPRLCDVADTTCHCHEDRLQSTDILALHDLQKIPVFKGLKVGDSILLTKDLIKELRTEYKNHSIRVACAGCEWFDLCTESAEHNFKGTRIS